MNVLCEYQNICLQQSSSFPYELAVELESIENPSSGEVTRVWVGTGAKVAPQQVENINDLSDHTE